MNLRVDLMFASERRSASILNLKSLLNIATVVLPAAVLVFISILWVNSRLLGSELSAMENRWADIEPRKKAAIQYSHALSRNLAVLKEMEGWQRSQVLWHPQLLEIQKIVPPMVQLQRLKAEHTLVVNDSDHSPLRRFTLTLRGKGVGESAERDIEVLKNRLLTSPEFAPLVESVNVNEFDHDLSPGAGRDDRVFRIDCAYRPRRFDEATGRQERTN